MNARLAFEHVEAGGSDGARLQGCRQRRVVDDAAACDVGEGGGRLHQLKLLGADRVMRRCGVGQHQHQVIGLAQQRGLVDIARTDLRFCFSIQLRAVVVDHLHAEAQRTTPRDGPADAPHAQDAQRRAMHVGTGELVEDAALVPLTGAHEALGFAKAPGRCHHQREAEVGGRFGQHVGRIGHQHAACRASRHVDVVVADADIAHRLDRWASIEQCRVDSVAAVAHHALLAVQALLQFVSAPYRVVRVVIDLEVIAQALSDVGEGGSGDEDGGHCLSSFYWFCARNERKQRNGLTQR